MKKELQNKLQTSTIFNRFKNIPDNAFHDFYFFYQFYLSQISTLEFEEYVEIKFNYIQALFYLDKYKLFYKNADEIICELLNAQSFDNRSRKIYEQVLAFKAEAFRNDNKMQSAKLLYSQLLKLNPENKLYKRKLFFILYQNEQIKNRKNFGGIVLLIMLSLLCTVLSVFIIQPFFTDWSNLILNSRNVFFICGISGFFILQGIQVRTAMSAVQRASNKY